MLSSQASRERVLLAPVESPCRTLRLVVQDGNRTVQLPLPCHGGRGRGSRGDHGGATASRRREIGLYTSESDAVTVYVQPSFNAAALHMPRYQHQLYLIRYQGITSSHCIQLPTFFKLLPHRSVRQITVLLSTC